MELNQKEDLYTYGCFGNMPYHQIFFGTYENIVNCSRMDIIQLINFFDVLYQKKLQKNRRYHFYYKKIENFLFSFKQPWKDFDKFYKKCP